MSAAATPNDGTIDPARIHAVCDRPCDPDGDYILYWMRATRRVDHNFALDRALHWSSELGKPLVVLEALRCDYAWASDRHHAFVIAGMRDNQVACRRHGIAYHPYVEPSRGHGRGLLRTLAARAAVVVTDLHPSFHYPAMLRAAADQVAGRLEAVDSIGLVPLAATPKAFTTAHSFRAWGQHELPRLLGGFPQAAPLRGQRMPMAKIPDEVTTRWPAADARLLAAGAAALGELPIDHEVGPCSLVGGPRAALARVREFVDRDLDAYAEGRNHPDDAGGSHLSAYLHFGHVSTHAIVRALADRFEWTPADLGRPNGGAREGFWGLPPAAESFLDELVTWRELGHAFAWHRDDLERYDSLPDWAKATLAAHADDPREHLYDRAALEGARTHDPLWNAAQTELLREGSIHNYLRMLWGKKVLEWSPSPQHAADLLIELNNRWALDGRDPNSYSGIFWVFGRYDRPWAPERPIFGTIRYMTSASTARKLRTKRYVARYGEAPTLFGRGG